jgi:hypothetical protein
MDYNISLLLVHSKLVLHRENCTFQGYNSLQRRDNIFPWERNKQNIAEFKALFHQLTGEKPDDAELVSYLTIEAYKQ